MPASNLKTANKKSLLKITLKEGMNRQIRRISDLIGHPVIDLQRINIAGLGIKGLPEGKWRLLKKEEWELLIQPKYQ